MKKIITALSIFVVALALSATVASASVSVEAGAIATSVEDRAPVGVGESFSYDTPILFCYSKIVGASAGDTIEHIWYHGDDKMATVQLKIGSANWRTYSSKRIIRIWTGPWKVDIVHNGEVLKTLTFTINAPDAPYSDQEGALKVKEQ